MKKIRLIHDCSQPSGLALNDYATVKHFQYQTLDDAIALLKPNSWLVKVDLHAAYRSVRIHPDCYDATGIKWRFSGDEKYTYLHDTRLPFGSSRSPSHFSRIAQSVKRFMQFQL